MTLEEEQEFMEQLMDNYKNPKNFHDMKDYTFFRHQKNTSCGDTFDLFVKLDKNKNIVDVSYTGNGCAISTASFSLLSQKLIGMNFDAAKKLTEKDLFDIIGIKISAGRINCALLSLKTFHLGIEDYNKKKLGFFFE